MNSEWNVINSSPDPKRDIVELILEGRKIKDPLHFLQPKQSDFLPYTDLLNIDKAAQMVLKAIRDDKRIHILGDNDADGLSSLTIIYQYLFDLTEHLTYSLNEGKKHGIEWQDLEKYVGQYDLVIAVDSSSSSFESQKFLADNNIEFIILDHHQLDKKNPEYATIVNCTEGDYGNRFLSGSAITFKFIKYIDFIVGATHADDFWDLAATGLIGDMMDVSESSKENRYICAVGFSRLKNVALKEIIGAYTFNGTSISYSIAPLVNASMRLNRSNLAASLFLENDKKVCKKLIKQLKELKELQNIQKDALVTKLDAVIEYEKLDNDKVIGLIIDESNGDNQADIAGLTANVLASKYEKIFIIVHKTDETGVLLGSCRVFGLDNFRDKVNETGLQIFAMGHQSAFGISVKECNFKKLITALNLALKDIELKPNNQADIILKPKDLTLTLIKKLEYINMISGTGFKPISILIKDIEPYNITSMKNGIHSKFEYGGIDFIQWHSKLRSDLRCNKGIYPVVDVIGVPAISNFRGIKSKQMILSDYKIDKRLEFFR